MTSQSQRDLSAGRETSLGHNVSNRKIAGMTFNVSHEGCEKGVLFRGS